MGLYLLMVESTIINIVEIFGLPIVLLAVLLKGMLIGKPIPITVMFVVYCATAGLTTVSEILPFTSLTALFSTIGASILFFEIRGESTQLERLIPDFVMERVGDGIGANKGGRFVKIKRHLYNHLGMGLFVSNIVIGFRNLMTIPIANSDYSFIRFFIIGYVSTFIYHSVTTIVAVYGIEFIISFFTVIV